MEDFNEEVTYGTSLYEIYEEFLSKIADYSYLDINVSEEEINDELFGFLKSAIRKFYKCKNSLEIVENEDKDKFFKEELHPFEVEILVTLMLVEYMKPKVLSTEVLKQSLSDKDFRIYSQANQLRELSLLYRVFRAEASKMITQYTYFGIEEVKWK